LTGRNDKQSQDNILIQPGDGNSPIHPVSRMPTEASRDPIFTHL
jgi:hypothetical protein